MRGLVSLVATLAVSIYGVSAIQITSPTKHDVWRSDESNLVTWTSVETDPEHFALAISDHGERTVVLIDRVETSLGQVYVPPPIPAGDDLQINFVRNAQQPEAIYAQSAMFDVVSGSDDQRDVQTGYTQTRALPTAFSTPAPMLIPSSSNLKSDASNGNITTVTVIAMSGDRNLGSGLPKAVLALLAAIANLLL